MKFTTILTVFFLIYQSIDAKYLHERVSRALPAVPGIPSIPTAIPISIPNVPKMPKNIQEAKETMEDTAMDVAGQAPDISDIGIPSSLPVTLPTIPAIPMPSVNAISKGVADKFSYKTVHAMSNSTTIRRKLSKRDAAKRSKMGGIREGILNIGLEAVGKAENVKDEIVKTRKEIVKEVPKIPEKISSLKDKSFEEMKDDAVDVGVDMLVKASDMKDEVGGEIKKIEDKVPIKLPKPPKEVEKTLETVKDGMMDASIDVIGKAENVKDEIAKSIEEEIPITSNINSFKHKSIKDVGHDVLNVGVGIVGNVTKGTVTGAIAVTRKMIKPISISRSIFRKDENSQKLTNASQ